MSMAQTKQSLEALLTDRQVRVLALSGKWGTGKTEMLRQLREASQDDQVKNALTVSLFGVASLAQMKLKLAQCVLPLLKKRGPQGDALRAALSGIRKGIQGFFQLDSAMDELALLSVPVMVRDKFIVLDDIERKHDNLSIDEVLGFIDDFTQNYGCRIMLILNTDQLTDKQVWETFREKVIDEELRLETTPAEAFDIAIQLSPSAFASKIRPAVEGCGLTNIRIIRKVIRSINKILAPHTALADDVLTRVIPSTVLLSAIHFKGIDDGPTMKFVLDFGSSLARTVKQLGRDRRGEVPTDEDKLHARWALLLDRIGISATDEYEKLVSDYLDAGLVDRSAVDAVIDRYRQEQQRAGAQARAHNFFQVTMWDPDLPQSESLKKARELLNDVPYLDCYTVTALHDRVLKLEGGASIAEQMISLWIARLKERAAATGANPAHFKLDNWAGQPLHPMISAAFADAHGLLERTQSLLDVCLDLAKGNGWDPSVETILRTATVEDFMHTILSIHGEELRVFLYKNLDILAHRETYSSHFGSAPENFLEACKRIRDERAGTRWASLIENVYSDAKLDAQLDATPAAAPA